MQAGYKKQHVSQHSEIIQYRCLILSNYNNIKLHFRGIIQRLILALLSVLIPFDTRLPDLL